MKKSFKIISNTDSVGDDYIADEDIGIALDYRFGLLKDENSFEQKRGKVANDKLEKLFDDFLDMMLE